jgi:hypothetical protein
MKVLLLLILSLITPASRQLPQPSFSRVEEVPQPARKGGRWYFAENGHAVYCYGPVRLIALPQGGLQRVATFCQGSKPIVPLRD